MKKLVPYLVFALCFLVSCGSSRAEKAVQEYEALAEEIVEAKRNNDIQRLTELSQEASKMALKYNGIDRELNDKQKERMYNVLMKIQLGGLEKYGVEYESPFQ